MPPSCLNVDPEAQTNAQDRQVDDIAEKRCEYNTETQTSSENHRDPSSKPCSMCPAEAKEEDGQMTKNWVEDTGRIKGGILVFAGLFSVIVALFITEGYKKLSSDSGDQAVALLTQLVNVSTGAPVVVQSSHPFKAPASIVRVNVMWFLSLIFSLSCAFLAALMEPWARRYLEYAQHSGVPRKRARIRAYMSEGVEKFRLSQTVEEISLLLLLLHTSVFLFFAGLIDFLLPVNEVVAFSALGCIVVFASIYAISALSPGFLLNCTPLSGTTYILLQLSALDLFSFTKAIERILRGSLLTIKRQFHPNMRGSPNDWPTKWKAMLEHKVLAHYERLSHCLRLMVELGAMRAPPRIDPSALHSTHTTLNEDKEDLAARMPGSFDFRASSDTTSAILSLLAEQPEKPTFDPTLGSRLHEFLEMCLSGAPLLTEEQRRNCLRVILKRLWCCVRTYDLPENSEVPLAPVVRAISASPEVIGRIRTEQDPAVRLLGRCCGSLIVKKLASDIISPTSSIASFTEEMACLSSILGATSDQVRDWLGQECAIDLVNAISLASGEFETLVASGMEGEVGDVFQQTLSVLAEGIVSSRANVEWDPGELPVDLVARFHEIYSKFANARVPDVLKEQLRRILDRLPPRSYV
ncbi:hypothetical protein H4582DRAFT_2075124 [Lactarius indigo]|nr:hypothetical protein H4582DRAFT_2075124 [Lactarius indigo]